MEESVAFVFISDVIGSFGPTEFLVAMEENRFVLFKRLVVPENALDDDSAITAMRIHRILDLTMLLIRTKNTLVTACRSVVLYSVFKVAIANFSSLKTTVICAPIVATRATAGDLSWWQCHSHNLSRTHM